MAFHFSPYFYVLESNLYSGVTQVAQLGLNIIAVFNCIQIYFHSCLYTLSEIPIFKISENVEKKSASYLLPVPASCGQRALKVCWASVSLRVCGGPL